MVLAAFAAVSNPFSTLGQDLTAGEALYKNGNELYDQNKYQESINVLEKALAAFEQLKDLPGQIKTQNLKAECLANLGQCDKAIGILKQSLAQVTARLKEDHPQVAETYYYLSRAIGGCSRKHEDAIAMMYKSMALKKKRYGENALETAFDYNFLGYLFHNKGEPDSALVYLSKALKIRQKKLPGDHIEVAHTLYNLARVYEDKSELSQALELHQLAYQIRREKFTEDNPTISNSVAAIGNVYQKFGNYDRALDYLNRALQIRKKTLGENHSNVAGSYYTIGNLHSAMFNYHSAIQYYKQGNRITENNLGPNNEILATYYAATGKMYGRIGEHKTALEYITKARTWAEKNMANDHPYLAIVYNMAGDYYAEINDLSTQADYYKKAISIFHKAYSVGSTREADVLLKMGEVNAKNKRFDEAVALYHQALIIFESKMGKRNPKVASVYLAMGDVHKNQHQYKESLEAYQKAFASVSSSPGDSADLYFNPRPDDLESKSLALRVASSKAEVLLRKAKAEVDDRTGLKRSLATYKFAMQLIDLISAEYNNESAKIELEKESRNIYSMAIYVAHQLYLLSSDETFLEDAFAISEKSKSVLLLENIRDSRAKTLAGVPDSLVKAENDVKIELAYYKNAIYQSRKGNQSEKIQTYEKNAFDTQQKYDRLKRKLEKEFPAYYDFKYNTRAIDVASVRELLPDEKTAVVEFFVSDTSIYIFSVAKQSARLEWVKRDSANEKLLSDYEKSLTNPDFILNFRAEADGLYAHAAYKIYELLLQAVFETAETSIQRLIIVPDDVLARINFGTLLTKEPSIENLDYKTLHYLSRTCEISYAYSSAFIKNDPVRIKKAKHIFAGFAPSYTGGQFVNVDTAQHPMIHLVVRNGDLPLPGAVAEVKHISGFMRGKSWLDEEATESNFKQHAGDYKILHLAMHTLLNNENPEYSELLFSHQKDRANDGFLKISEIYNLKLNADMVVLSACSSGYGKIQKGEGPISISRAFSYAGCPSVVMSLWKVPDDVTRQIMTFFYEELMDNKRKDEALQ